MMVEAGSDATLGYISRSLFFFLLIDV